jgi:hypothetical protein
MLKLIDVQPIKAQCNAMASSEKTNASLELGTSTSHPLQETSFSRIIPSNSRINPSFKAKINVKGPNLYSLLVCDPSHYLECELILETEERQALDSLEPVPVICHFPNISSEKLQDHIWSRRHSLWHYYDSIPDKDSWNSFFYSVPPTMLQR